MRFDGYWQVGSDGVLSPVLIADVRNRSGSYREVTFLVDTGADATVLSYDVLVTLQHDYDTSTDFHLEGVGGTSNSVLVTTQFLFKRDDGTKVPINGKFSAFTDPNALDLSVLGRDILNLFSVIVDRPGDVVCLLTGRHRYIIQET